MTPQSKIPASQYEYATLLGSALKSNSTDNLSTLTMFQVFSSQCKNCLLSKDRIVPPSMAKEIVSDCIEDQKHFICHVSTMEDDGNVCCRKFYEEFGHELQVVRIAQRLDLVEEVEQPVKERLPSYEDMNF